tara:strand:+ start:2827 stop:3552 length:726 start_codon:yes stop_codon:yes gene_type:complete
MNKVLIVGASGATGKLLVDQLLHKGIDVIAIVRPASAFICEFQSNPKLKVIEANISEMTAKMLSELIIDCDAVVSCLGHNLTFKGMFGEPKRLVTDAIKKLFQAIELTNQSKKIKIILMNTTGNSNRDIPEKPCLSQRCVISILRVLLPPHADNEEAADFLRLEIGQHHTCIEWLAVRPDSLTSEDSVTPYDTHLSPTRNAIFDSAPTSRINVAHFMSELIIDNDLWQRWKGKMPVIYNRI